MTSLQTYRVGRNRTILSSNFSVGPPVSNSKSHQGEIGTMLAGSMMLFLSLLIMAFCFFFHRRFRRVPTPTVVRDTPWAEENLEIFTLRPPEEFTRLYLPQPVPTPPPPYEAVVRTRDKVEEPAPRVPSSQLEEKITIEEEGLPTYEDAMRLEAQTYL